MKAMKSWKKIVSVACATALMTAVVAGCGGDKKKEAAKAGGKQKRDSDQAARRTADRAS